MKGRKLSNEEVAALAAKQARKAGNSRLVKQELYDTLVAEFDVGDFGELTLGVDEKKLTVRNNVTKALQRRGLSVDWRRGSKETLRFQVTE